MSDTAPAQRGAIKRIRLTPLHDLLRGRITGWLDWRGKINGAGLPAAVSEIVTKTVARTGLWLSEKAVVADELIAHFRDGLEAGESAEGLVRSFGDPRAVAKLIGSAKRRGRAWPMKLLYYHAWTVFIIFILYSLLAVRFFVGRPHPSVDYVARMNAATLATPIDRQAWPLYRRAILGLRDPTAQYDGWPKVAGYSPYGKHWPEIKAWLGQHAADLETIRAGAGKPAFGFILGPGGSSVDPELQWNFGGHSAVDDDVLEKALISVLLPYLNDMRAIADVLADDAQLAVEQHDSKRAERDIQALFSIADQLHARQAFVVGDMVSLSVRSVGLFSAAHLLHETPEIFDDAQWTRLAHRISENRIAADVLSFATERLFVPDVLQRTFTDDGHGSGRLTFGGALALGRLGGGREPLINDPKITLLTGPGIMTVMASRGELLRAYNNWADKAEAALHVPLRERPAADSDREKWSASRLKRIRFDPLLAVSGSCYRAEETAERYLGFQDGLVVAISLELYDRRHGQYPASLNLLTPDLVPQIPADRITGEPVHYKIVEGKPLIYSVGADRRDDGGLKGGETAVWGSDAANGAPRGDWVLYPHPPVPSAEGEE